MIGLLMRPELEELIQQKQWDVLRDALSHFHPSDIAEILVESFQNPTETNASSSQKR